MREMFLQAAVLTRAGQQRCTNYTNIEVLPGKSINNNITCQRSRNDPSAIGTLKQRPTRGNVRSARVNSASPLKCVI